MPSDLLTSWYFFDLTAHEEMEEIVRSLLRRLHDHADVLAAVGVAARLMGEQHQSRKRGRRLREMLGMLGAAGRRGLRRANNAANVQTRATAG